MLPLTDVAHTAWPMPRWNEPRLAQLRVEAAAVERDLFNATLAQAKLFGAEGRIPEAREMLQQAEARFPAATISGGLFRNLLTAAIVSQGGGLARTWLSTRYRTDYALDLHVTALPLPPEVVQLTVRANSAKFAFGAALFQSPACESLLQRWADIFPLFDAFMKSPHRVDGTVAINLGDGCGWPGLAFCANERGFFLIPDAIYMDTSGYRAYREALRRDSVAWADRRALAIWRGATTGSPADPTGGWRSLPRVRLCEIGRAHSNIIDAGITSVGQIDDAGARDWLATQGLLREHIPAERFQEYRYQIDIDGNTNSWPGLFMKLLTGSPVLKVASPRGYRQWYYDRLQPWINYIPVETAMDDLVEKITWLQAHEAVVRRIGEAGRDLAETLADEQEIARTAPVFAAAIRTAAGAPFVDLRFGAAGPDIQALRTGWLSVEAEGAIVSGFEGRLELPMPFDVGDLLLIAELSPIAPPPQRVMIIANGEKILQCSISERTTVRCALPPRAGCASETLNLSLCVPDCQSNASQANPLDRRILSVKLHRIAVAAAHGYKGEEHQDTAQALVELRAVAEPMARDSLGSEETLPPGAQPHIISTFHGTILYADPWSGLVRHGPPSDTPRNLYLVAAGGAANLFRQTADGRYFSVGLRPERPNAARALTSDSVVSSFDIEVLGAPSQQTLALRGAGLYLCADTDGRVSLSRIHLGPWEQFQTKPIKP